MEPSNFKVKDASVQKVFDDMARNGLGIPIVAKEAPTPDTLKPNVLTKHGNDFYIKTNDGIVLKLQGTVVS